MRCPQCQTENWADRKFCASCGVALERVCAGCGFKNSLSDRFCGGCGRSLTEAPAASEPAHALPERRPVAVLIADLANFTRLSAGRDPEDTQRLLARYFEAIDPIALQHGGTIDKHMGDAMMALFGAPVAHGDDALRAARAAIAIHRRLDELSRESGEAFGAHIGIALGEVLAGHFGSAGHAAYTVTGDAPTIATRLMEAAPAGETWVDDAIAGEIAAEVPCRKLSPLSLKGLDSVTAHVIAQHAGEAARPRRQMIGRRGELAQLVALMAETGEGRWRRGAGARRSRHRQVGLASGSCPGGGEPRVLGGHRARARFRRHARDASRRQPVRASAAGMHGARREKRAWLRRWCPATCRATCPCSRRT